MKLFQKSLIISKGNYYDSIHNCTIYAFNKVISEGDLKYLLIGGKYDQVKAKESWIKIFDEYINEFGLPKNYERYLKLMIKSCELQTSAYVDNKRHLLVNARLKEADALRQLSGIPESIYKTTAKIAKFMGMPIDIKTTTVAQYYSYIDIMQNG